MNRPAVFLDRDGTLIRDADYLSDPADIEWLPGVFDFLKACQKRNYLLVIITNQSGIARGYFSEKDYLKIADEIAAQADQQGVRFDAVYFCPHGPDDGCDCRKPSTGLFEKAVGDLDIDVSRSLAVGDRERDLEPAGSIGVSSLHRVEANEGLEPLLQLFEEGSDA